MTALQRLLAAVQPVLDPENMGSHWREYSPQFPQYVDVEIGGAGDDPRAQWYTISLTRAQLDELRAAAEALNGA